MFRKTPWRETIPDLVRSRQDEALATTIRVLVPYSLAAFLVEEEGATQTFKVCLGDPHTCTCPVFAKEAELCKHICWILLRRFKLPRGHEYSFQRGLEVKQLLELLERLRLGRPGAESVRQKRIEPRDVCPVCLEELLLKRLPVSHCRFSCSNSVHISCMTIWAETQKVTDGEKSVACPLCRGAFSSLALLQEQAESVKKLFTAAEREEPDRHVGVSCCGCRLRPVTGRCFKCTVCSHTFLCEDCRGSHSHHPLAFKTRRMEDWLPWSEGASCQDGPVPLDPLPDHVMGDLPVEFVGARPFPPTEGAQCRLCLISFRRGHRVRNLPCGHKGAVGAVLPQVVPRYGEERRHRGEVAPVRKCEEALGEADLWFRGTVC